MPMEGKWLAPNTSLASWDELIGAIVRGEGDGAEDSRIPDLG